MKKDSVFDSGCPVARSLERIGDPWSILILRDAFAGFTRFDEFQKNLGIAPNMLSRRLNTLVEEGLLERRQYSEHPPRCEYVLTERGRDVRPILLTLQTWGNKHFAPEGLAMVLVDQTTGVPVNAVLVDSVSGKKITEAEHVCEAGPAATERMRWRLSYRKQKAAAENENKNE
jgi:DNA-binding HxlR family transcriptional regulator